MVKTLATRISVPSVAIATEPLGTMASKWLHGIVFLLAIAHVFGDGVECHGKLEPQVSYLVMQDGETKLSRDKLSYQGTTSGIGQCTLADKFKDELFYFIHTCGLPDAIAERCFMITRGFSLGQKNQIDGLKYWFELSLVKKGYNEIVCDDQQSAYM
uniref:Conserved secreted protein n=1 Tax=Panagrellus redivivus TaxID=6233 RepID=A0A7E4VU40_PANRE